MTPATKNCLCRRQKHGYNDGMTSSMTYTHTHNLATRITGGEGRATQHGLAAAAIFHTDCTSTIHFRLLLWCRGWTIGVCCNTKQHVKHKTCDDDDGATLDGQLKEMRMYVCTHVLKSTHLSRELAVRLPSRTASSTSFSDPFGELAGVAMCPPSHGHC